MKTQVRKRIVAILLIALLITPFLSGNLIFTKQDLYAESTEQVTSSDEQVTINDTSPSIEPTNENSETATEGQEENSTESSETAAETQEETTVDNSTTVAESQEAVDISLTSKTSTTGEETGVGQLTIINIDIVEFNNSGNKIADINTGDPYVLSHRNISGEVGQSWFSETKEEIAGMEYFSHSYGDSEIDYSNYGYFAEGQRTLIQFYQPEGYDWGVNEPGMGYVGIVHKGDTYDEWDIELGRVIISGHLGEPWTESPINYDYWIFVEAYPDWIVDPIIGEKGLISGIFRPTEDLHRHQWLTYVYFAAGKLTIEYKDIDTGDKIAADSLPLKRFVKSNVNLSPITIGGYELITALNTNGKINFQFPDVREGNHIFTFEYKKKTSIQVTKAWADGSNQDGMRPESVTIILLANGQPTDEIVLTPYNNWTGSFSDLDEYAGGQAISYTIQEVPQGDNSHVGVITGDAGSGFTVTNTHTPETFTVSGRATWVDADDQDRLRPGSISINLLKNGGFFDQKTVTVSEGWAWDFTDLDKFEGGVQITYTLTEDAIADYTTEAFGYNFTNTHLITNQPTDPTGPEEPTNPTTPEQPTNPTTPEKPTNPTIPEKPSYPTAPTAPIPTAKVIDAKMTAELPSTGESDTMYTWISALFLGLGFVLIALKRQMR